MPITIQLSKAYPVKGVDVVPEKVKDRVLGMVDAARNAVDHARTVVMRGRGMTTREKEIWTGCFKAEPTPENTPKAYVVLTATLTGIRGEHTIKLASCDPYVREGGAIHLKYDDFIDEEAVFATLVWNYIHEATHKFANTEDAGVGLWTKLVDGSIKSCYLNRYDALTDRGFQYRERGLLPKGALKNADSYAGFATVLRKNRMLFQLKALPARAA